VVIVKNATEFMDSKWARREVIELESRCSAGGFLLPVILCKINDLKAIKQASSCQEVITVAKILLDRQALLTTDVARSDRNAVMSSVCFSNQSMYVLLRQSFYGM
jgi:hypothetical protein